MSNLIKYTTIAFAILFTVATIIISLIARKNRFEKGNDDLYKVFYLMLVTSAVMIYMVFFVYSYY